MRAVDRAFGIAVRHRREALGLSQEELAYQAGLHRTYVSLIERGLRSPSIGKVSQLAKALKTTSSSLMEGVDKQIENSASEQLE